MNDDDDEIEVKHGCFICDGYGDHCTDPACILCKGSDVCPECKGTGLVSE